MNWKIFQGDLINEQLWVSDPPYIDGLIKFKPRFLFPFRVGRPLAMPPAFGGTPAATAAFSGLRPWSWSGPASAIARTTAGSTPEKVVWDVTEKFSPVWWRAQLNEWIARIQKLWKKTILSLGINFWFIIYQGLYVI